MKIAHLSDLHFCPKHLAQVDPCVAHAIQVASSEQVDLAVITGDITDHALDAHSPAFVSLANRVRDLANICPVLLLQGTFSHEPPGLLRALKLIGARHPIHVAERLCQVAWIPNVGWLESEGWCFGELEKAACVFSCIPTVNKADVAAAVGAEHAAEQIGETLFALLSGLGVVNSALRERGVPTVGLGHGTVAGCLTEHEVPMAGLDHEFGVGSLAASKVSAFMLGHIHKHQAWRLNETTIAYAGSIARLHYGEHGDKGLLIWDVEAGGADFVLHKTPARRTLEFEFAGPPDLQEIRNAAAETAGAFVRVRFCVAEEDASSVDRAAIAAALQGAEGVKIEGRIIPITRSRAEGIGLARSLQERLARWAEVAGVAPAPLVARLNDLVRDEANEIVGKTIGSCSSKAHADHTPATCASVDEASERAKVRATSDA